MNFTELKTKGWQSIDDNPTTPKEVTDTLMGQWINELYQDLAPQLDILKSTTLTFTAGVATLPADFLSPHAVYAGDDLMQVITDITDKVSDSSSTSQVMIQSITEARLFGADPESTVTLWYKAVPAALTGSDTPSYIPARYHHLIAEVGVKMKYAFQTNKLAEYEGLRSIWEGSVKAQIGGATDRARRSAGTSQVKVQR